MFCVLGLALHYTDSRADRKIKELEKSRRESDSLTFELGAAVYKNSLYREAFSGRDFTLKTVDSVYNVRKQEVFNKRK
jgi:hypothetical protein